MTEYAKELDETKYVTFLTKDNQLLTKLEQNTIYMICKQHYYKKI